MNHTVKPAQNFIQKFIFEALDIRGAIVRMTDVWQIIQAERHYPAQVSTLLGQMCAIAVVVTGNLKQPGRITFQIQGQGAVPLLVVDCDQTLNLRAMATYHAEQIAAITAEQKLIGNGRLQLTLDMPSMKEPYRSLVPFDERGISATFEHYLTQSEQLPAIVRLAAHSETAAAIFVQKLPGADSRDADGWERIRHLTATLSDDELLMLHPETILTRLYAQEDVRLFAPQAVRNDFPPDRDKAMAILYATGEREVRQIIEELGEIVISDELSNHHYRFLPEEIDELFAPGRYPDTLH